MFGSLLFYVSSVILLRAVDLKIFFFTSALFDQMLQLELLRDFNGWNNQFQQLEQSVSMVGTVVLNSWNYYYEIAGVGRREIGLNLVKYRASKISENPNCIPARRDGSCDADEPS